MLKRKPKVKSGIERGPRREFPQHRAWVRQHSCAVRFCESRDIEAAHYDGPVPYADRGGKSRKDHDKWCFPLCRHHHRIYHNLGWFQFDKEHGINSMAIAEECARRSPHRWRWQQEQGK